MQIATEREGDEWIVRIIDDGREVVLRGEEAYAMLALSDQERVLQDQMDAISRQRWQMARQTFRKGRKRLVPYKSVVD